MSEHANRPRYHAVVKGGKPDKPIWNRIGAAFQNENNSLKVVLNANPIDGQFWLFETQDQNQNQAPKQPQQAAQPSVQSPVAPSINPAPVQTPVAPAVSPAPVPAPVPPQAPQPQPAHPTTSYDPFTA